MAKFLLECGPHTDAECEAMSRELEQVGVPDVMRGIEFACSCPFGTHGGWGIIEASDETAALAGFGPVNRAHLKAVPVEIVQF